MANSHIYIAKTILTGTQQTITFSTISQDYKSLMLYGTINTDSSGQQVQNLDVLVNSDTGTNYDNSWFISSGSNPSSITRDPGNTKGICKDINAGTQTSANNQGFVRILFSNYSSTTTWKVWGYEGGMVGTSTLHTIGWGQTSWKSNSAITSITLRTENNGNNFAAGTAVYLYGIGI